MSTADIIGWLALAVAIVGGLLSLLRYFTQQLAQEQTWREDADELARNALARVEREFADYKLHVAQNYVSVSNMRETEERLANSMEKIAARLETIVTRLERLSIDVAANGARSVRAARSSLSE